MIQKRAETWRGATLVFGVSRANLTDNHGNNYKQINITPIISANSDLQDSVSLYPQKEYHDAVVFELPVENADWLHLELPASNFGGSGMLRFEIPFGKISEARQAIRKALDAHSSYLANKPYLTNSDYVQIKATHASAKKQYSDEINKPLVYQPAQRQVRRATVEKLNKQIVLLKNQLDSIEQGVELEKKVEQVRRSLQTAEASLYGPPP